MAASLPCPLQHDVTTATTRIHACVRASLWVCVCKMGAPVAGGKLCNHVHSACVHSYLNESKLSYNNSKESEKNKNKTKKKDNVIRTLNLRPPNTKTHFLGNPPCNPRFPEQWTPEYEHRSGLVSLELFLGRHCLFISSQLWLGHA